MANSLLDFVMAVVRDPDAAAQYAANPAQAIADANLTDVSSVDVNNLIPVVSESLSMGLPSTGTDSSIVDGAEGNVWASGAATAAFDAFDDHLPVQVTDVIDHDLPVIAQQSDDLADGGVPSLASADDFAQAAEPVIDEVPLDSPLAVEAQDWAQTLIEDGRTRKTQGSTSSRPACHDDSTADIGRAVVVLAVQPSLRGHPGRSPNPLMGPPGASRHGGLR